MSETPSPKPFLLEVEDAVDPGLAPAVPEAEFDARAAETLVAVANAKVSGLTKAALWVFGSLFTFVLSVSAYQFVANLIAANPILGAIAFVLVVLGVAFALLLAAREAMGFARLARIDHLRERSVKAHEAHDLKAARLVTGQLATLYKNRPAAAWGVARFAEAEPQIMDADAQLLLAETEILLPLDRLAQAEVEAATRRVALVTALVPVALADVAAALYSNVAMIRRIAEIYGGRAGTLGSWSLLRKVFASLLAAGAAALVDDLVGSIAGGGVLSKLSRRFGEGLVNGALTARIGVAAMEMCRPLPFRAVERPSVTALVSRALAGVIPRGRGASQAE